MTISILAMINGVLSLLVCLRILTYQRNGARYKPVISALAAILVFATGGEAVYSLLGLEKCVTLPQVIITAGMTVAIFAHKGNVSGVCHCLSTSATKFSRFI